jgi:hypothetical protein
MRIPLGGGRWYIVERNQGRSGLLRRRWGVVDSEGLEVLWPSLLEKDARRVVRLHNQLLNDERESR